jgi:hypothetical protein
LNLETDTEDIWHGAILSGTFFLFHFLNITKQNLQYMFKIWSYFELCISRQMPINLFWDLKNVPLKNIITPCEKYSMSCKRINYFLQWNNIFKLKLKPNKWHYDTLTIIEVNIKKTRKPWRTPTKARLQMLQALCDWAFPCTEVISKRCGHLAFIVAC